MKFEFRPIASQINKNQQFAILQYREMLKNLLSPAHKASRLWTKKLAEIGKKIR
jgi:hypothetical protein